MNTHCTKRRMKIKRLGRRNVQADFDGGQMTSDAGALLLGKVDERLGLLGRFASCFTDHRNPKFTEHSVPELVRQRIFALSLGYEDLNDHDELSRDPLLATVVGKADPTGQSRHRKRDKGRPLAGKSTLNRVELTGEQVGPASRYHKVALDFGAAKRLFPELFLDAHETPPELIVLDFDATNDPLHGNQEGRFFQGYYKQYCYLPMYVFCGDHLLAAELRTANVDPAAGTIDILEPLVKQIRARWPNMTIILRGDSGFARDATMAWCEDNSVHYVLGLPKNARLTTAIEEELVQAKTGFQQTGQATRVFKDFRYRTRDSWTCQRRVVGKAEHLADGANPRFVVTSLSARQYDARALYEDLYCARGEMENRIKEQQLCLFADRTSTATMRGNQIRLWFSSMAYTLLAALRRLGLAGTKLARARCDTIRLKLLKIGASIRVSVRRIWISMASSFPLQDMFVDVLRRLESLPLRC